MPEMEKLRAVKMMFCADSSWGGQPQRYIRRRHWTGGVIARPKLCGQLQGLCRVPFVYHAPRRVPKIKCSGLTGCSLRN